MDTSDFKRVILYFIMVLVTFSVIVIIAFSIKAIFINNTEEETVYSTVDNTWNYAFFDPDMVTDYNSAESSKGGVYWVVYNDPDAEWYSQIISMDKETYEVVLSILKAKDENTKSTIIDMYEPSILYKTGYQPVIVLKEE